MSDREGVLKRVFRFLGLDYLRPPPRHKPPHPKSAAPPWSGAFTQPGMRVLDTGAVKIRWKKERLVRPSGLTAVPWEVVRRRARQRFLVALAVTTVLVLVVANIARFSVSRILPPDVRGVWETDVDAYSQRRFELRAGIMAFQTGDSAGQVTTHAVTRVWRTGNADSTLFRVQYFQDGEPLEFSFAFMPGPPARIRFANQPHMLWAPASRARSLIPEFPF